MSKVATLNTAAIAKNINHALDLRGWNVRRLAIEISSQVVQSAVYRICRGEVMPSLESLAAIAAVLDRTIDELISED